MIHHLIRWCLLQITGHEITTRGRVIIRYHPFVHTDIGSRNELICLVLSDAAYDDACPPLTNTDDYCCSESMCMPLCLWSCPPHSVINSGHECPNIVPAAWPMMCICRGKRKITHANITFVPLLMHTNRYRSPTRRTSSWSRRTSNRRVSFPYSVRSGDASPLLPVSWLSVRIPGRCCVSFFWSKIFLFHPKRTIASSITTASSIVHHQKSASTWTNILRRRASFSSRGWSSGVTSHIISHAGVYTCEVSSEAPSYSTLRAEQVMQVYGQFSAWFSITSSPLIPASIWSQTIFVLLLLFPSVSDSMRRVSLFRGSREKRLHFIWCSFTHSLRWQLL